MTIYISDWFGPPDHEYLLTLDTSVSTKNALLKQQWKKHTTDFSRGLDSGVQSFDHLSMGYTI